jgi:hypothetical protein
MVCALELEQFKRFCHSWYQSCRFTFAAGTRDIGVPRITAALKNAFRIKICLTKEFIKYVGLVKVCA